MAYSEEQEKRKAEERYRDCGVQASPPPQTSGYYGEQPGFGLTLGCGIGWAVKQMWHGLKVRRVGWNGRGMWIALQVPDINSKMSQPYVYMSTVNGTLVPWLCSQSDLLANDWETATV